MRCGRVDRSGRSERDRDRREGKGQPVHGEIKTDGEKETKREKKTQRNEGEGEPKEKTVKNSPPVKLPAS